MTRKLPTRTRPSLALAALILLAACSSGSDGPSNPTAPTQPIPTPAAGSSTFRVVTGGGDQVLTYTNGANLVFCRTAAGWADLWMRFAEQRGADGEAGHYLDIDLCGSANSGGFAPKDPQVAACAGGQQFDIWWHGADGTYFNTATAPACSLQLTRNGSQLSGTFSCAGLVEFGGTRTLDVLDGSFSCVEE